MFKFIFIKIYYFFSLILLLLLFLIQKIVLIRVGYYYKSKIGHLIGNTQIYLYKLKAKKKFNLKYDTCIQFDIWISWDKTLYPVIESFYKNKIVELRPILLWGIYVLANKYSFFKKFLISEHDWGIDYYNLNYTNRTQKIFNKNQIEYAENKLKEISIFPDNKIACFINRNNFFNSKIVKDKSLIEVNEYRNTNFKDYLPAIKYLEDKGYKIVRMGSHEKNFKNKYVINYSSSKISNHLIDMFLLKKAELIISSGTGIDNAASHFFKKPVCYVNLIPYLNIQNFKFSPKGVFITKKLVKKKKLLSLKEIINMNYFSFGDSKSYDDRGIKVLNNSKKEILECVKEFYKINIENYKYKKKELLLQKKFYNILNSELYKDSEYENILGSYKNVDMSLKQKPLANFSLNFLNNNKWFLKV